MSSTNIHSDRLYRHRMIFVILMLTLIRLLALWLSPYDLYGDEAQYWSWSKNLDWGYFSKPPMVAWIIASSTALLGDNVWAIRLPAPFIHAATIALVFLCGRKAFDSKVGFWAGCIYGLMPAIWLSSMIMTTDIALLFFWSLALYLWLCLRKRASWPHIIALGFAIGLGVLSKYAMLFCVPILILASAIDAPTRRAFISVKGLGLILTAGLIISPNILWNINNNFITVSHVAANTNLSGKSWFFRPDKGLGFIGDQFGVFGPVPFALLLWLFFRLRGLVFQSRINAKITEPAYARHISHMPPLIRLLLIYTALPLLVIIVQGFLSRANANWAVTAYPSAAIMLAYFAQQKARFKRWLDRGLFAQTILCSALIIIALSPSWVDRLGLTEAVERVRGWPDTVEHIAQHYEKGDDGQDFQAIIFDTRILFYNSQYYGRAHGWAPKAPLYIWQIFEKPRNHAELRYSVSEKTRPDYSGPVLIINRAEGNIEAYRRAFSHIKPLEPIEIHLGRTKTRKLYAWAAYIDTPQ